MIRACRLPRSRRRTAFRSARRVWQAWRRAALDFASLLRRLDIKCYLESRPTSFVAVMPDGVAILKRDLKSRRDAGLDAVVMNPRAIAAETGVVASAGLRLKESATIDPYRATLGLAAAARDRGAALFEGRPRRRSGSTANPSTCRRRPAAFTPTAW